MEKRPRQAKVTADSEARRFDGIARCKALLNTAKGDNAELKHKLSRLEDEKAALVASQEKADAELVALRNRVFELEQRDFSWRRFGCSPQINESLASLPVESFQSPLARKSFEKQIIISTTPRANIQQKRRTPARKTSVSTQSQRYDLRSIKAAARRASMITPARPSEIEPVRPAKRAKKNPFERFHGALMDLDRHQVESL